MKNIFLTLILSHIIIFGFSQTPQIALVKPNGTTTIHSTFDAAYTAAADDDYIYLPGGTFSGISIDKRLHVIGAGSNIDSSQVTGRTKIPSITLLAGAQGGSIDGIYFFNYNTTNLAFNSVINGYLIKNCRFDGNIAFNQAACVNITILNNVLINLVGNLNNSIISNNIILASLSAGEYSEINNNIFFIQSAMSLPSNSQYKNNIFSVSLQYSNYSLFYNNVNCITSGSQNENYNYFYETFPEIFENPGISPYSYDVHNNYRIKPTSLCKNSGTDGTDRGIYGGMFPWIEGQVPSNPHIYFKQVTGQTNSNGQLQVQYKVRTGN